MLVMWSHRSRVAQGVRLGTTLQGNVRLLCQGDITLFDSENLFKTLQLSMLVMLSHRSRVAQDVRLGTSTR